MPWFECREGINGGAWVAQSMRTRPVRSVGTMVQALGFVLMVSIKTALPPVNSITDTVPLSRAQAKANF